MSNSIRNIAKLPLFTQHFNTLLSDYPYNANFSEHYCKLLRALLPQCPWIQLLSLSVFHHPSVQVITDKASGDVLCSGLSQLSVGVPFRTVDCKIRNAHITDSGASFSSRLILDSLKLIRPELSPGFLSRQDVHQGDSAVMQTKAFLTAPSNCQQWSQAG